MKTIKAEILMIEGAPFPVIKEIYDPSNERRNGNITPEAPIVITGHNLDMLTWESTNLYLVSSVNDRMLIECGDIHKYSDDKIYMTVPDINEGEYFLALMILMKDKESFLKTNHYYIHKNSFQKLYLNILRKKILLKKFNETLHLSTLNDVIKEKIIWRTNIH